MKSFRTNISASTLTNKRSSKSNIHTEKEPFAEIEKSSKDFENLIDSGHVFEKFEDSKYKSAGNELQNFKIKPEQLDKHITPKTKWEDVSEEWLCPECGAMKDDFEMVLVS